MEAAITIPSNITTTVQRLDNTEANRKALQALLKQPSVAALIGEHKKHHADSSIAEYTETLRTLISAYNPGHAVNTNELVDNAIATLTETVGETRSISRNALRDSFIPLLEQLGIITGDKPRTWAWLDTRTVAEKVRDIALSHYRASLEKTPAEIELLKERRNQNALKKVATVVEQNRAIQDDIRHNLDYILKEDKKCRDIAFELGIPYSKAKENAMKKRTVSSTADNIRNYGFIGIVAAVLIVGLISTSGDDNSTHATPTAHASTAYAPPAKPVDGLTAGETEWRQTYIILYRQNGQKVTAEMEQQLIELSGEHMITLDRMKEIVKGISPKEVQ